MRERTLKTVLLVQAIEQSDPLGELLPHADRAEATRNAARDEAKLREALASDTLSPVTVRFLKKRAEQLRERMEMRSPVIRHVLRLAGGGSWLGRVLALAAFLMGASLSALDGSRHINILAFPLIGLILWNLVVYAALIFHHLRPSSGSRLPDAYENWIRWRATTLLRRSSRFNAPLAAALRGFAREWGGVTRRLMILRAKRLFHVCAALVAVGLIAGIYIRGIALRYEAGWESTFLGPGQVRLLLNTLYGPASVLSGIPLPASDEAINSLKWTGAGAGGGTEAATWIHLLALTALLYIIVPRLIAAGTATLSLWWYSRRVPVPPSLIPYARETLAGVGGNVRHVASVTPYAYEPASNSIRGLEQLLTVALGGAITVDMRDPVRYGDEESYQDRQSRGAGRVANWNVLLMNLAATPEAENHGVVIAHARDSLLRAPTSVPLALIVDEAPFVSRLGKDISLHKRLEDRRELWKSFIAGYGLKACLIDLSRFTTPESVGELDREALRGSLWIARDRAAVL
jgi:Protein of unknown function (DUF2868)